VGQGAVCAPKKVYDEVMKGKDYLRKWIKSRSGCRVPPSREVQNEFRRIAAMVKGQYSNSKAVEFLSSGDGWVIASALANGGTVVTLESLSRKKKVRMPEICDALEVKYCRNLEEMLSDLGADFLN
jgi:hypothetical protein